MDQKLKVWDSASRTLLTSAFPGGGDQIDPQITSDGRYLTTKCGIVFEINGVTSRSSLAHQNRIDDFAWARESGHLATVVSLGRRGVHTRLWLPASCAAGGRCPASFHGAI